MAEPARAGSSSPVTFRAPLVLRLMTAFGTLVLGLVTAGMTAFGVLILFGPMWPIGLFVIGPCAFLMGALTGYVARDLRGRWGLRVVLGTASMVLHLPGGRSLIPRPPAEHLDIRYQDVEAVESRLEAYGSLGMMIVQRAFVLHCKDGRLIFLFEDRALGTRLKVPFSAKIASAIAERARVPLRDLGMVKGKGGALAVWGAHAPDWATAPMSAAEQLRMWRHAAFTGSLAIGVVIAAMAIRVAMLAF